MSAFAEILANPAFWVATLRIATPLILGTLGVLLCERAGVLNLGIEGIMVAGAFTSWLAVYLGLPLWGGVAVAALTGATFGLLHAALTVGLALSQHVTGLGITLLATSLSYYGYRVSFPKVNTPPTIVPFGEMSGLGVPILGAQTPLTLFALLSGALAGLAGAIEVAGRTGYVTLDMSPGYGYGGIVIAMLAGLHPLGVLAAGVFVAGVQVGADSMSRALAVPTYIADVIVSVALLSMLVATAFGRYRLRWT